MAQHGLTEDAYLNVSDWATWEGYSPEERSAIELAEKFAVDHMALDDAYFERLRGQYSDEQIHAMLLMIGSWIAFGRLQTVLDVHVSCALRL